MPTLEIEKVKCADCDELTTDPVIIGKDKLCEECITECEDCNGKVRAEDIKTVFDGDRYVCESCYDNYVWCSGCDLEFDSQSDEWARNGLCVNCSNEEEIPYRDWERDKKLEVFKKGAYMQTDRLFGVEIEAQYSNDGQVCEVAEGINASIGIAADAGAEFQTPPSCGYEGERMIKQLTYRLRKHKLTVPDGCGFHLHIDAHDMDARSIKNLWLLYIVFDDVIRGFINDYRKKSHWCRETKDKFDEVMDCATQEDLEKLYYGMFTSRIPAEIDTYYLDCLKSDRKSVQRNGFNLQCVFAEKHLEIRYHESTLSGKRVLEWANLHCLIMDLAKQGFDYEWIEKMHNRKIGKRQELFAKLGLAPSSCHYWMKVSRNLK